MSDLIEIAYWHDPTVCYEWNEWHAYWDPERQVYVVGSGTGCSCDCYDEDCIDTAGITSKDALIASLKQWVYGDRDAGTPQSSWSSESDTAAILDGYRTTVAEIRSWKKPSGRPAEPKGHIMEPSDYDEQVDRMHDAAEAVFNDLVKVRHAAVQERQAELAEAMDAYNEAVQQYLSYKNAELSLRRKDLLVTYDVRRMLDDDPQ